MHVAMSDIDKSDLPRVQDHRAMRPLRLHIGGVGLGRRWVPIADFTAASRACREFIEANDLGASAWRGGQIVDDAGKVVATVSYNGRVWLADGCEAVGGSAG